jgi:zinc D-Ala-D-Ala carboxypeptidase
MSELSMPLSKDFTLEELLQSEVAERDERLKREQQNPPSEIVENLKYLTETVLQPLRTRLGFPIRITSGYRCALVNKLVGGSATSQHCSGEAADCQLAPRFLEDPETLPIRDEIIVRVQKIVGSPLRPETHQNFYLFAYVCIHLNELDVDQIIHEYGQGFGNPAWVHISASKRQDRRQILMVGSYTNNTYIQPTLLEALSHGT